MKARRIVLVRYPEGIPSEQDFALEDFTTAEPGEGELLVRVSHLSMDPFPRLRMNERGPAGPPMQLGAAVEGRGVGQVIASRAPGWSEGDWLIGEPGWQSVACLPAETCEKVDLALGKPSLHLGALGPSGLTAYLTVTALGGLTAGETMVFAPAAGSVGSVAGQIAALLGGHAIGVASGGQATALAGLGYATALDHTRPASFAEALSGGVDLFIDGVGGATHDAVLPMLKSRGRIVLLGFVSGYNDAAPPRYGNAAPLLMKRARMEGFLLADWQSRFDEARTALSQWIADGKLRHVESIWSGLEAAPQAFAALFSSAPPGKQIVSLEDVL